MKSFLIWVSGQRRCNFKRFLIWSSCNPPVQWSGTIYAILKVGIMGNFGKGYQEEQFCEIILNFGQWFRRRCCLKVFLIWSSCSPLVQRSVTICAILVGAPEEQFCEIIFNMGQWSEEMSF